MAAFLRAQGGDPELAEAASKLDSMAKIYRRAQRLADAGQRTTARVERVRGTGGFVGTVPELEGLTLDHPTGPLPVASAATRATALRRAERILRELGHVEEADAVATVLGRGR
jgi:hypothetical protein